MKAIIPAAGMGTRFLPATKATPKEMLPVLGKPVIQYVVEEALAAGADEVIVVTSNEKPSIETHFSPAPALEAALLAAGKLQFAQAVAHAGALPVSFVEQDEPRGLGHAVLCAADLVVEKAGSCRCAAAAAGVTAATAAAATATDAAGAAGATAAAAAGVTAAAATATAAAGASVTAAAGAGVTAAAAAEPFFVLLGDVMVPGNDILSRMKEISDTHNGASVIAVFRVPREQVSRFGVIDASPEGSIWKVNALVEKPPVEEAPSELAVFGRYLLSPKVMEILAHTEPGVGGEIQLTDALVELLQTEEMYALEISPESGFDTGTIATWLETNIRLALLDANLAEVVKAALA